MKRRSSRIKIKIIDNDSNSNLRLPGIPFWLISFFSCFLFIFKPFFLRRAPLDDDALELLQQVDRKLINEIIYELRSFGSFDLVDISTGDGTKVKISIL